ncbi:Uncharacterized protein TrispH2_009591 [Trichoplax sp. H2]|nr:Uncharacterized protein TrispH2_009591 [Trichoplax sp. H2]|eukprot:RDD38546.1 Uncharacterized protein TrispH2_009591 [Trichoplax sp. H2]
MSLLDIWEEEEELQLQLLKAQLDALIEEHSISRVPFENLVFEGGGVKGMAYVGALQVLNRLELFKEADGKPKIRRYAGASAGAMLVALLAVGFSVDEIANTLEGDTIKRVIKDDWRGKICCLPNLILRYGWNPGGRLEKWFQRKLAEGPYLSQDNRKFDLTFRELYDDTGIELCVLATNLNRLDAEYFHPKTTPHIPIYKAVRMSMSLPGYFTRAKYKRQDLSKEEERRESTFKCIRCLFCCCCCGNWEKGATFNDIYTDGGLVCNYPIHVFDGWWLSMKEENTFLRKVQSGNSGEVDDRFKLGEDNKTIGFLLFSENEPEIFGKKLIRREQKLFGRKPITQIDRLKQTQEKRMKKRMKCYIEATKKHNLSEAFGTFIKLLREKEPKFYDEICYETEKVKECIKELPKKSLRILKCNSYVELLQQINPDGDKKVTLLELLGFMQDLDENIQFPTNKDKSEDKVEDWLEEAYLSQGQKSKAVEIIIRDVIGVLSESKEKYEELYYDVIDVQSVLTQEELVDDDIRILCSEDPTKFSDATREFLIGRFVHQLNVDDDGMVTEWELYNYVRKRGIDLKSVLLGHDRVDIRDPKEYIGSLVTDDFYRTVGINTYYVKTTEWEMTKESKRLLVKSGRRGTIAFIKSFIDSRRGVAPSPILQRRGMNSFLGNPLSDKDNVDVINYPRRNTRGSVNPAIIVNRQGKILDDEGAGNDNRLSSSSSNCDKNEPADQATPFTTRTLSVEDAIRYNHRRQKPNLDELEEMNHQLQNCEIKSSEVQSNKDICVEVAVERDQNNQPNTEDQNNQPNTEDQNNQPNTEDQSNYDDQSNHHTQSDRSNQSSGDQQLDHDNLSDKNEQHSTNDEEGCSTDVDLRRVSIATVTSDSTLCETPGEPTTESEQQNSQSVDLNTSENDDDEDVDFSELERTSLKNQNKEVLVSEL